jgi:threonine dehydrogenase-like Zn-dependent dehydrogenase
MNVGVVEAVGGKNGKNIKHATGGVNDGGGVNGVNFVNDANVVDDGVCGDNGNDMAKAWVGKTVVASNDVCCLTCPACRSGLWRNCPDFGEIGFAYDGAYAEYMTAPIYALRELPPAVSHIQAAMLEPLGVALGTFDKIQAKMGETMLIFGAGSIGLNMLAAAKAAGLRRITVVERSGGRLDIAKEMGASHVFASANCDIADEIKKVYPSGPDIVVECTGSEDCLRLALSVAPKSGRIALAGYGRGKNMSIRIDDIHIKNLVVAGAGNNWNVLDRALGLVSDGIISTGRLCTGVYGLSDFAKVADMAAARPHGFVKAIFDMN